MERYVKAVRTSRQQQENVLSGFLPLQCGNDYTKITQIMQYLKGALTCFLSTVKYTL